MPNRPTAADADGNAALAYSFWLARSFRDGSPEEDLFKAVCVNSNKLEALRAKAQLPRRTSRKQGGTATRC
jgi:hypothetical protein